METNQDYIIVETLRNQGVPESEIQSRLQLWERSRSVGGSYDPILGNFKKIPLPHEILSLEGDSKPSEVVNHDASTESSVGEADADGELLRNNHLPIDTYGKLAKSLINEFSQAYKVNPDVIGAIVLLIVGGGANRKITIRAWNYINSPCFWLGVVERSGSNKSEPMTRLLKPLAAINKDLIREYNKAYADFASSGSKGTPPARQKIIIADSTPEVRNALMVTNGLVLVRDELNGFFKDIGRYSSSGEIENLPDRQSPVPFRRAGSGGRRGAGDPGRVHHRPLRPVRRAGGKRAPGGGGGHGGLAYEARCAAGAAPHRGRVRKSV